MLWDISGAFGDIGVFIPIAIALILKNGANPTAVFLVGGLFYIFSARYFKITMPVQPLKAMSAIAISLNLSFDVMMAAGIIMGFIMIFIAITKLSVKLGRLFPVSVIRGIQLGLGMMLIKTSFSFIIKDPLIGAISAFLLFVSLVIRTIPPLVPVLFLGLIIAGSRFQISDLGPILFTPVLPEADNLLKGFVILVLPQLALSFGNAIVATEVTAKDLYGSRAKRVTLTSIPLSLGIANIVSGLLGGAPMCHGSGGLTAHYKFGARDEKAGYIVGITFIILGLVFGKEVLSLITAFPNGILGVLLFYVGLQHTTFIKDICNDRAKLLVCFLTGIMGYLFNNLTYGFLFGILMHYGILAFEKSFEKS